MENNQLTLRQVYDAFGKGDVETVLAAMPEDMLFHVGGRNRVSGDYVGRAEILGCFGKWMELSGGTFRVEVLEIVGTDDGAIVVSHDTAHHEGRLLDQISLHLWHMPGGKIRSFRGYNQETWDDFWA